MPDLSDFTAEQQTNLEAARRWNEQARRDRRPVTLFIEVDGRHYMLDRWGVHEHTSAGPPYDHKAPVTCAACLGRLAAAGVR